MVVSSQVNIKRVFVVTFQRNNSEWVIIYLRSVKYYIEWNWIWFISYLQGNHALHLMNNFIFCFAVQYKPWRRLCLYRSVTRIRYICLKYFLLKLDISFTIANFIRYSYFKNNFHPYKFSNYHSWDYTTDNDICRKYVDMHFFYKGIAQFQFKNVLFDIILPTYLVAPFLRKCSFYPQYYKEKCYKNWKS